MRCVSHIAIGVNDMDVSLPFYRDVIGLTVCLDTLEGGDQTPDPRVVGVVASGPRTRRAVYLRWEDGPDSTFIVLSAPTREGGVPLKMDQLGHHHVGFWVDDIDERIERLKEYGTNIIFGPADSDSVGYGEEPGNLIRTCIFEDPDGVLLQFDQRL